MKVKSLILGAIIAVVFLMFCVYGSKLIYKAPEYADFCNNSYAYPAKVIPAENCTQNIAMEKKSQDCWNSGSVTRPVFNSEGCQTDVVCDYCNKDYDRAYEKYSKNLFVISLALSVLAIVISAVFIGIASIYGGLMLGSLFFLIYGTAGYWRFMTDVVRFIILGVALVALVYLGYYLSKREGINGRNRKD